MKSIKEKQMLVKWAKALNEEINPLLLKEVEDHERLQAELKESLKNEPLYFTSNEEIIEKPIVVEKPLEEIKEEVFIAPEPELPKSVIERAAEYITKETKLKESFYQNPNPPLTEKNFNDVTNKIKYLEQWVGKIASHGPGGGDANPHDVIEFLDRGVRFTPTSRMMYWNNTEDCVNITQADGSTLQVGLENYIRVYNNTANTFANGTFVEFTGIDAEGDAPTFRAYINDANAQPLYNIGVLTTDVLSNTHGRATVLGLVRDLDTTGNAVGESWASGDLLWASPSYPGNYTKFKPTAPNVALSVAAVTVADATNGIILVRPTIWPRLHYGDFYRQTELTPSAPNTDTVIPLSNTLTASGFTRAGNTIVAFNSGLYKFDVRIQLSSSSSNLKSAVLWFKKNNTNIPYSSVRASIATNGGFATITNTQLISLTPNDNVSIHFAATDTTLFISSPEILDGSPNVPAVQLSVLAAAL